MKKDREGAFKRMLGNPFICDTVKLNKIIVLNGSFMKASTKTNKQKGFRLIVIRSENISTERKKIEKEPSRGC